MKRLGIIILLIGLLGINSISFAERLDRIVAVVKDQVITADQLNSRVAQYKAQIAHSGHTPPPASILRKQVLQRMIYQKLQLQLAKQRDITVDDLMLNQAIKNIASRNHIPLEKFKHAVEAQGISFKHYKQQLKQQLIIQKLQSEMVGKTISITPEDVAKAKRKLASKADAVKDYHLYNILIALPDVPTSEDITAAKKHAEAIIKKLKHGADFQQIAMAQSAGPQALQGGNLGWRKLGELPSVFTKYVEKMKSGQIKGPIRTGNGFHIIKLAGVRGRSMRRVVTEYHVRQILIKTGPMLSAKQAKLRLERIRKLILAGGSFKKLAEGNSHDQRSVNKGGDMGWVAAAQLEPMFAQHIVHLKVGQLSKPFHTAIGWHIAQVLGHRRVDDTKAFLTLQARQMVYRRKFMEKRQMWLQSLRENAYVKIMR